MSRFDENREILRRLSPQDSPALTRALPEVPVTHEKSRSGASTLRLQTPSGGRYLHSRYDPQKEAARLAERQEGFLVIFGFGCGYFAAAAARRPEVAGVLAVEPVAGVLSVVAREAELSHLRNTPEKLRLLELTEPQELVRVVAAFYSPALHEKISLHLSEGYDTLTDLSLFRDAFREGVARAAGNYRTMARLGRAWSRNIITNAALLASGEMPHLGILGPPKTAPPRAVVLGAGPGLEEWIRRGGAPAPRDALVLAADTALPALGARGIVPDIVASIDSQAATYLHYMPRATRLPRLILADLTAPPLLSRLGPPVGFFSGGHPLSTALLPEAPLNGISTEGGNVGFTLLSAAGALGASEIAVAGVEYAYLRGRAYARGSYLDTYFFSRNERRDPLTSYWSRILYRDPEFAQISDAPPWSYTDPRLRRFAESFDRQVTAMEGAGVKVYTLFRNGSDLHGASGEAAAKTGVGVSGDCLPSVLTPEGIDRKLTEFAEGLSTPLSDAPRPLWALTALERALLPLLAWCREHPGRRSSGGFEAAREITVGQLARLGR